MMNRQVYVFTESFYQVPAFTKTCAAFKNKLAGARTFEKSIEHYSYPPVLLYCDLIDMEFLLRTLHIAIRSSLA